MKNHTAYLDDPSSAADRERRWGPSAALDRNRGCHSDIPGFLLAAGMTEELQILWSLRGLDEQLVTLHGALARYPADRKTLEVRMAAERARLEELKKAIGEVQLKHRQIEKDIEALQQEERKFQSQLPMVKKNEEYSALLHEIADRKGKRSERETDLLMLMDEEQRLHQERPAHERSLKKVEDETAAPSRHDRRRGAQGARSGRGPGGRAPEPDEPCWRRGSARATSASTAHAKAERWCRSSKARAAAAFAASRPRRCKRRGVETA